MRLMLMAMHMRQAHQLAELQVTPSLAGNSKNEGKGKTKACDEKISKQEVRA